MVIALKTGMDPHSREIVRVNCSDDVEHVGYVQRHPGKEPCIVLSESFAHLTISEAETVLSSYKAVRRVNG